MANTTSSSSLRNQIWGKKLFTDSLRDTLFFANSGAEGGLLQMAPIDQEVNAILHVATDLKKQKGEQVTIGLGARLSGTGVDGDSELEGNEEKANFYSEAIAIGKRRNGIRLDGSLDEQKAANDLRENAKNQLKKWRTEFMERQVFLKLAGVTNTGLTDTSGTVVGAPALWSNTPDYIPNADEAAGKGARYLCANASGTDAITSADKLTPQLISRAKAMARLANPKIRPIRVNGRDYYAMFVHEAQGYDLKYNSTFDAARRDAEVRGKENPIFTGALGVWDGVIIYETEMVPFLDISAFGSGSKSFRGASGADANADLFRALLCGAQAAVWAECENDKTWVEKTFDYEDKVGFSTSILGGVQKVMFNAKEYGVIAVDTSATDFS